MSFKAVAFVVKQEITKTAPQTLLLMMLANYANEYDEAYPSVETLSKLTRLDKRTVRKCLLELQEMGLISDTLKRYQSQITVYKIHTEAQQGGNKNVTPLDDERGNKNVTPNKNVGGTNLHERGNNFVSQGGTNLHERGNKNVTQYYYEPIIEPNIEPISVNTQKNKKSIKKPTELDEQIWTDFLKTKKQRTKSDLTLTAWNRFYKQVQKASEQTGHSVAEIFEFWIADVKWDGFNSEWYVNRMQVQNTHYDKKPSVMDELREMAKYAPQDEFINDLPNNQAMIGAEYE